ncbi:DNA/RNA non-specific endonuclease [Bacteroidales bacterium M08MB]|nr:DNA/RNA non-specific endonuclease [Perlabentimonas gracilis]
MLGTAYGEIQTFSTSMALPTVSTVSVSSITWNAAAVAGDATSGGGGDITERGFCWSTAEEPTIDDEKLQKGEGLGEFSLVVENLTPEQTYYLRAYAINAKGVAYGETISFTTLEEPLNVPDNHHMLLGNPSSATDDILNANDYLMVKDQFHLSYNNTTRTANWVSWHLNTSYLGDVGRQDDFRTDYSLPSSWYRVSETSYRYSGFDRGHLCPSGDRTATVAANSETFLMTNMMPQSPNNNRITWAALETYCRNLAKSGKELYIVAGPHGQGGTGSNGYAETIDNDNIVVPSTTWKIIVVLNNGDNDLERINTNTRVIAVIMPNTQDVNNYKWYDYRVSVNDVEELTGFDFLSNVSTSIQEVIEAVVDNVPI